MNAADHPAHLGLDADVLLRDGSTLRLRRARAGDEAAIVGLWPALSAAHRTFHDTGAPPADWLARLLAPDDVSVVGLVADGRPGVAAVATWTRSEAEPERAAAGFAVADSLRGFGVGTKLLEVLAEAARHERIRVFEADLPERHRHALQAFADSGFAITASEASDDVIHVELSLDQSPATAARSLARAEVAATASIRPLLEPRSVAVVGASRDPGKIGSIVLRNLRANGFPGSLYGIHPSERDLHGIPAFPTLTGLPAPVDLVVVCVPAGRVAAVAADAVAAGARGLIVITAGFSETGDAGRALEAQLLDTVRQAGLRMVGPNCMGVLNTDPAVSMNATFSPVFPPAGRVAMSTQSGALGLAILDQAARLGIGISSFASIGNKADVSANDLLLYWASDPRTDVILLYLESFGNPRRFGQIARHIGRRKPIVAVKAGRSAVGARAASSHTGALATSDDVVDALFSQAGVIRTSTMAELFDVTLLLAHQPLPPGRRVAVLTNAGGPAILAADACTAHGLEVPRLSAATESALRDLLPPSASVSNPVDMIASATADQYERALTLLLDDRGVDAVLTIFIPPLPTQASAVAAAVRRAVEARPGKPVLANFMSAEAAGQELAPVPCFAFPESAAAALARAAAYAEWRRAPDGTLPEWTDIDTAAIHRVAAAAIERGSDWLPPDDVHALLDAVGLPRLPGRVARSVEEALAAAQAVGYPVAIKAIGPMLVHKTEAHAVRLGVGDADAVRAEWNDLAHGLGDRMTGALVQPMVTGGAEMLIGAFQDPAFGPVLLCATGGTLTEVIADRQVRMAPLTREDARAMIDDLRGVTLLRGHRGRPALDEAALADALLRLSALVERCPELQELDINPLVVLPRGVVALDARIRVAPVTTQPPSRRIRL